MTCHPRLGGALEEGGGSSESASGFYDVIVLVNINNPSELILDLTLLESRDVVVELK